MHSNNDIKVLIFSSDHFINSFVELKDHFNFNFDFFEEDTKYPLKKNVLATNSNIHKELGDLINKKDIE